MHVEFETSAFADAMKKAANIGREFGLKLTAVAGEERFFVSAATREVSYRQEILDASVDEAGEVVVTNQSFPEVAKKFPLGSTTQAIVKGEQLSLTCDDLETTFVIPPPFSAVPDYPKIRRITDTTDQELIEVDDLSSALAAVAFAVLKDEGHPLSGVRIDGDYILATDRYKAARVKLEVPIDSPITIPVKLVGSLIPKKAAVEIGATRDSFLMRPDPETEIVAGIYGSDGYPDVHSIWRRTAENENRVRVQIDDLGAAIQRARAMAASDDAPRVRMESDGRRLTLTWANSEGDALADSIPFDVVGGTGEMSIAMDPDIINGILAQNRAGSGTVEMWAPPLSVGAKGFVQFDCNTGLSVTAAQMRTS